MRRSSSRVFLSGKPRIDLTGAPSRALRDYTVHPPLRGCRRASVIIGGRRTTGMDYPVADLNEHDPYIAEQAAWVGGLHRPRRPPPVLRLAGQHGARDLRWLPTLDVALQPLLASASCPAWHPFSAVSIAAAARRCFS